MMMDNVPASLRGELTRWLLEGKAGVFVGNVNAAVREQLWKMVCKEARTGNAILVYSSNNEQGFIMEMHGNPKRRVIDVEGLQLISERV